MSPERVERRLAAILSADAVGYSRRMAEDEAGTVRALRACRERLAGFVAAYGGRVVDAVGDNLLAEFASVVDAVECAARIQDESVDERLRFRVGVNLGDVVVDGERIYGDGVNVAARIEQLADEGGVALSGAAFDQVEGKLALDFEALGERELKNIPKPVRVYRVRPSAPGKSPSVPGFSGRPAIAVLPFENLGGDPEQEHFTDGIAEDLLTRLSLWRHFPVIARNSSFVYKKRSVDLKRAAHELGARYVVEGSVRRAGNRVRITAQLIDATTGHHVWAEKYDRELTDVFALQDEITESIVGAMYPEVLRSESERIVRREPASLDAWECAQRARWLMFHDPSADSESAQALLWRAIELDPGLSVAYAGLSWRLYWDVHAQQVESPEEATAEALRLARKAVELDPQDPFAQLVLGNAYSLTGRSAEMFAALERAVQLDPSLAQANFSLGLFLALARRSDEAIERIERALRLSPRDPAAGIYLYAMAVAHFGAGRYEEAIEWAQRSLARIPDHASTHRYLAASHAWLGRLDEARVAFARVLELVPDFSLEPFRRVYASADPDLTERLFEGLRRAGARERAE